MRDKQGPVSLMRGISLTVVLAAAGAFTGAAPAPPGVFSRSEPTSTPRGPVPIPRHRGGDVDSRAASLHRQGLARAERGDLAGAIESLRGALRLAPANMAARAHLAIALFHRGDGQGAMAAVERGLRIEPTSTALLEARASLRAGLGDEAGALADLAQVLERSPERLDLAQALAWTLATHPDPRLRDTERALRLAQRVARSMRSERADVYDTLAVAYAATGRLDRALESADWALRTLRPSDPDPLASAIRQRRADLALRRSARPTPR